jgi:hypothetical protein
MIKINSPLGITILSFICLLSTGLIILLGWPFGITIPLLVFTLIILLLALIDPKYAFFLNLFFGYTLTMVLKLNEDLPFGIVANFFPLLMFFILIIQKLRTGSLKWSNFHSPVSYAFLVLLVYYFLEVLNPEAHSVLGWAQNFREVASNLLLYFVTLELCNGFKFIKQFSIFWLALSIFHGFYGMYQEYFGFLPYEVNWLHERAPRLALIYVDGVYRIVAGMTSPTTYGIGMAISAVYATVLLQIKNPPLYKILLGISIIAMLLGMAYSGTRTADVMLPAALIFFLCLNLNNLKLVLISMVPLLLFITILILPDNSNYTLFRFKSAFVGNKDASFNVRDVNRHKIQPYMRSHLIGGGIATTSNDGIRFNPGHILAGWPTDSGYVKIALEEGVIGIILYTIAYWIILRTALVNYTKLKDYRLRIYGLGMLLVLFSFIIAHITQDAIYEHPNVLIFYIMTAIMVKIPDIEADMADKSEIELIP